MSRRERNETDPTSAPGTDVNDVDGVGDGDRTEAFDELAGTLAHEFSNLLTAMQGRLELLLDRFPGTTTERHLLLDVKMGADAASRITRQLLAISGRQASEAEPTDLNALIHDVDDTLQQIAGTTAELRLDLTGALPAVNVDPRLVRQVLFGLIAAARDSIGIGTEGRITVSTLVESDLLGPSVRLSVADTRPWSDRDVTRMFAPQPSTGRQARGAGLTLAAIRGTVRQCGASIVCERTAPTGIVFHIRFPISAA